MADQHLPPPGYPAEIPNVQQLTDLHEVMVRCTRCDLFLSRCQVVPGQGSGRAALLLVGEAPGEREDREGMPFIGRSGELLNDMLGVAGLRRDDVFVANVVRCRPPGNRNPRVAEIQACAGWLREQIRLVSPTLVVTLGGFALQHFFPKARITAIHGEVRKILYDGRALALYPLMHPAAVLRNARLRDAYAGQFARLPEILRSLGPKS